MIHLFGRVRLLRAAALGAGLAASTLLLPAVGLAQTDDTPVPADPVQGDRLTLDEVIDRVSREAFDVRVARGDATIAATNASWSAAGYLPTLDGTVRYQGTEASQVALGGFPGGGFGAAPSSYNTTTTGLGLSWTAIDLARGPAYQRLRAERALASALSDGTLDGALQNAITAYVDVVRQGQVLDAIRETVALSEERVRLATVQARAGTVSELDAGLARVDLNADRAALLRQEAALVALKSELSVRMGGAGDESFSVADSISVDRGLTLAPLRDAAQQNNRSLAAARLAETAVEAGARAATRGRLPTLALQSGYQVSGFAEGAEPAPFNQDDSFTYGLTLSVPLFDGLSRRRAVETAQIRSENARATVEQVEAEVRAAVVGAHARYDSGLRQMDLESENVTVARRNVEIAYAQLRAGTITAVDLRQVQVSLLDAQTRLFDATFGAKQAETELRRLSGSLAP